ncbi:energy-coupling factor ABC transporter ATP-binding protein [Streptomyces sp. AC495_CC817]|uniref:energy-coupling factor ABC transporter ATP-binding protein n=1 Tax=Streptomyces sp. AC495_CC817 TaxID=2823900 RepID=UPI0020B7B9F9|nr:ABC transporter ATP-binding protein [Streptomyces sp. AC495_CC817]
MTLRMEGVHLRLGDADVLRDVSLDLTARTVAVIGDNGSGKSSFARVVGGLVRRTAGTVNVLGLDADRHAAELRRRTAMVFSNPDAQILMPTVSEDVTFSLRGEKRSTTEVRERVTDALSRFGLAELADRSAHDLSGGQKQLLALCGALVRRPDLVIADEPTAYLDARNAARIADHLFEGDHRVLLVTHDLALAERCDAAVLFVGGRIASVGGSGSVVSDYQASLRC